MEAQRIKICSCVTQSGKSICQVLNMEVKFHNTKHCRCFINLIRFFLQNKRDSECELVVCQKCLDVHRSELTGFLWWLLVISTAGCKPTQHLFLSCSTGGDQGSQTDTMLDSYKTLHNISELTNVNNTSRFRKFYYFRVQMWDFKFGSSLNEYSTNACFWVCM